MCVLISHEQNVCHFNLLIEVRFPNRTECKNLIFQTHVIDGLCITINIR